MHGDRVQKPMGEGGPVYLERLRLTGKTVIVAGAGGGNIGTATSMAISEAGARVVAVDILKERVEDTRQRIEKAGGTCLGIVADVRERSEVDRVISTATKALGPIHGLANVAGGSQPGDWWPLEDTPDDIFDRVLSLNLRYAFMMCRGVAKEMIAQGTGGSIVNVASVAAITSAAYHGPYGAAKSGLMALTRTMAVEWGPHQIRANAVAPGATPKPHVQATSAPGLGSGAEDGLLKVSPLGRNLKPEDIASGILFLLSDLASQVTGVTLVVDGGATANFALGGTDRFSRFIQKDAQEEARRR